MRPEENESKGDFIMRCIPVIINEGTARYPGEAAEVCTSIWNDHRWSVEKIKDIDSYNPSDKSNAQLADDWRILVAWTATLIKNGDW